MEILLPYLLAITLFIVPSYAIKFNLSALPANLLMVWVFLFWLIFFFYLLTTKNFAAFFTTQKNRLLLIFTGLFFMAGLISLFVYDFDRQKLGQFIVIFLQPISLFFIGNFLVRRFPKTKYYLLNTIYFSLAAAGLYAAIQYFTLWGLPPAFWGNSMEPKRAVSFFIHPNFYALWCAPLLAFLIPDLFFSVKDKGLKIKDYKPWAWLLGCVGLLLSLSRAGWLGLAAAMFVYLIFAATKKIRQLASVIVIILVIIIVSVPNLRWRFALPFYGEKSAVSRLSLWQTGINGIKESPILGLGLTGFSQNWNRLNTDPGLTDTHNFPHNIFLDFWVETGALGLISFIGLVGLIIYRGLRFSRTMLSRSASKGEESQTKTEILLPINRDQNDAIKLGVVLFLIALTFQGLVDNPYFKNDLAMVFWIILSLF